MVTASGLKANLKIFGLLTILTGIFIGVGYALAGTGGMIIGLVFAGLMNFASYWFSDKLVLKMYGAEQITEEQNPGLHNRLEKLAENAGIPKPRLYKSSMDVPNAFATGRNPEKGVVCVTDGLVNNLDDDEVDAVIAHELAHIKNRDTLINASVATIAGAISILAEMAFWGAMFGGEEDGAEMVSALAFMIITPIIATIIRMAISRKMEYRADSNAVQIHGQKEGLSSALTKIHEEAKKKPTKHVSKSQEAGANLFIDNPFASDKLTKWFSTHPKLDDRISNIEATNL
ncbi:MAG: zinc metalloprotease HtpX [Nanohaloarchaea archaeon]|nr:zinc metalloprotease HtpX [Candidatus Nanohaloarchaea archaeon]